MVGWAWGVGVWVGCVVVVVCVVGRWWCGLWVGGGLACTVWCGLRGLCGG